MTVFNIESRKEVYVLGCKERLSAENIQKIAEEQKLTDYSMEEFKVHSAMSKTPQFRYYQYKLAY